jgi:hypothetical protein
MSRPKKQKSQSIFLRASGWKVWTVCGLSLVLKDETPFPPEQDEFALEGTKIHAAIEADLKGIARDKYDVETEAVIDFAVRVTKAEAQAFPIRTEVFNSAKIKGVTIGGTADALIDSDDNLTVIDFKTGWKKVEAAENEQLKIYAHLNAKRGQKTWSGVIINARLNSISTTGPHLFDKKYLAALADDATKRAKAKQTQVGNHCATCPALAVCVPVRDSIKKWVTPGADDGIKNRKDDWSELLNVIKPAEVLFKRIKSDATKYVELGGEIPGVSIEFSGGTRSWPNDLAPAALAERLGVDLKKLVADVKIVSPAQAEENKIAPREKINAVAIQPMRRGLKIGVAKKKSEGK